MLKTITSRIAAEGRKGKAIGSVMFAVMQVDPGKDESARAKNPVFLALNTVHKDQRIFSFGISDTTLAASAFIRSARRPGCW